jgi:hypothetical protein
VIDARGKMRKSTFIVISRLDIVFGVFVAMFYELFA